MPWEQPKKWQKDKKKKCSSQSKDDQIIEGGVWTAQLQEGSEVTEEVGDCIVYTEGELCQESVCNRAWMQQRNQDPATKEIYISFLMMVLWWRGWQIGRRPVISHHCEKEIVKTSKKYEKIHLGHAPYIGDGLLLSLHVHQHLWDCDKWKGHICEVQVAEEKVHGVWRQGSRLMSRMRSRFPSNVVRYMPRNRAKNTPCCSGCMGSPRRRNLDTLLWFSLLVLLLPQLGIGESEKPQWTCHKIIVISFVPWKVLIFATFLFISLHC